MKNKLRIPLLAIAFILALVVTSSGTSFVLATTERHSAGAAIATDTNSGHLRIYTGADTNGPNGAVTGTLLVDWTLNATNTDTGGVITLGTVSNVNASATGTAGYFRILKSDGSTAIADGDVGTSATSLVLNTTSIVSGGPCSLSGTITVPAGT
jgi:uncharacterized membrane protein